MGQSAVLGITLPDLTDPPNGPAQMETLTEELELFTVMRFTSTAARDAALPSPVEGMECVTTDTPTTKWIYDGSNWKRTWSAWASYVPAWANLTVDDGTQEAEYMYVPGGIRVRGSIIFGSGTAISGDIGQTLPNSETSKATGGISQGTASFTDTGTRNYGGWTRCGDGATSFAFLHVESGNAGVVNATNPFTFAIGDVIYWDATVAI